MSGERHGKARLVRFLSVEPFSAYEKVKRWRERNPEARNAMERESRRRKAEKEGRTIRPYRRAA